MARKEKKYHFIYKTTSLITGKYYIGMHSTNNLNDGYLGSGTRLRRVINKYGEENFIRDILEFCGSREELKKREGEIVTLNEIAKVDCMNIQLGGEGGGTKESANATNKIIWGEKREESLKRVTKHMKKLWDDGDFRKKALKNLEWDRKNHSEETKKLMSRQRKGNGIGEENSQYGTCWVTRDGENKKIKNEDLGRFLLEGWKKGRQTSIISNNKLTIENVKEIKRLLETEPISKIAKIFGVHRESIRRIKQGKTWKNIV
jgi:group I intron endonuclease